MADFVAVIRRAVDGLSDNTPEMRVRVYERARGAVQRQLENMKPRPPEDMLRRQLEKLEAAIREVEGEHAEALPPSEAPAVVEAAPEPVAQEVVHPEPIEAVAEPVHADEPALEVHAREPEPAVESERIDAPPEESHAPEVHADAASWHEPAAAEEPVEEWHAPEAPAPVHPVSTHEEWGAPPAHQTVAPWRDERHEPALDEWHQEPAAAPDHSVEEPQHRLAAIPENAAAAVPAEPVVEPQHEPVVAESSGRFGLLPEARAVEIEAVETAEPAVARTLPPIEPFAWDASAFDELPPMPAQKSGKPVSDKGFDDVDLFSDVHGSSAKSVPKTEVPGDGWRELKELAGFDKADGDQAQAGSAIPPDLDQVMVQKLQGKSFRMEPKRRRVSALGLLLALVGIAIVAGAGYAAWLNREALNNMVTGLISSAPKTATVADKAPATPSPATPTPSTPTPAAPADTQQAAKVPTPPAAPSTAVTPSPAPPAAKPGTDVASVGNDNIVNTKFTQRLLENGSEVDDGPAVVPGQPAVAEGKSVAEQNVAAAAPAPSAESDVAAPQTVTANGPSSVPPPAAQTSVVGAPEKLFLYEERLGQTSPTAIEGTVTWTAQEETGDDGRPEPTIQGNIAVPERGLTAIITFKRNTDSSLPASHLVELVFSLPPNFEGGAIDSVQRIAMKATEQDRGDALIAVPAKITDDFHMVALNDFPDARKTNLELLRTRNWIDIPITYRNGRRALLTLNKGATGTDVFNKVIGLWAAKGDVSSSQ